MFEFIRMFGGCFGNNVVGCQEDHPEFRGQASVVVASGDKTMVVKHKQEWAANARAYLQRARQERPSKKAGLAQRKKFRKKAAEWLKCVDNALRACADLGLADSVVSEDSTQNPQEWPHLVVCCDQGSDGVAAFNWLAQTQRFNGEFLGDPAHGISNDLKNALVKCGVWKRTLLMTAMLNVPHGPWEEQRFFVKLSEAHKEYLMTGDYDNCPLFNYYFLAMVRDRNMESDIGDADLPARIWDLMEESWCMWTKGVKVGAPRLFAVGDAAKRFDPEWHSKLLSVTFMMWEEGELEEAIRKKLKQKDTQVCCQACKNGLEFSYMLLSEPERQQTQRIKEVVSAEVRKHHGQH